MGSASSKPARRAAEAAARAATAAAEPTPTAAATPAAARRLPSTPTTHIPTQTHAQSHSHTGSPQSEAHAQQPPHELPPWQAPAEAETARDYQKILDAFHSLHSAVDKRAIPEAGYAKDNEMLNILKMRQERDDYMKLSEGARAELRRAQQQQQQQQQLSRSTAASALDSSPLPVHKASVDAIQRMLRSRRVVTAAAWTPEAAAADLGWDPESGSATVRLLAQYVNTAEPGIITGAANQLVPAVWRDPVSPPPSSSSTA
ncbi:hypothetical protein BC831DRAFT_470354 [Entophlyctis helioformis]|nr:hypothetical protein BC831DRAFT_470354 [Entophlyctis helioformis]